MQYLYSYISLYLLPNLLKHTGLELKDIVTLVVGSFAVCGTIFGVVRYFTKRHFDQVNFNKSTDSNIKAFQEWMASFQKSNTEKHAEIEKRIMSNIQKEELERKLLKSELENKILKAAEERQQQFKVVFDELKQFGLTISKLDKSSEHMVKTLDEMKSKQDGQDKQTLELWKQVANQANK